MKTRIEFTGTVDVYDDEGEEITGESAIGWVVHALLRGDKHASGHASFLNKVTSVTKVDDDD